MDKQDTGDPGEQQSKAKVGKKNKRKKAANKQKSATQDTPAEQPGETSESELTPSEPD